MCLEFLYLHVFYGHKESLINRQSTSQTQARVNRESRINVNIESILILLWKAVNCIIEAHRGYLHCAIIFYACFVSVTIRLALLISRFISVYWRCLFAGSQGIFIDSALHLDEKKKK